MVRKIITWGRKSNRFRYPTRIIYPFLIFLKTIGLLTPSIRVDFNRENNVSFKSSRFGILYNILLLSSYFTSYVFTMSTRMSSNYPGKFSLIDSIVVYQAHVSAIAVSSVLVNYCFKQKLMAKMASELTKAHKKFETMKFPPWQTTVLHRSMLIGIVNFFLCVSQWILSYIKFRDSGYWFYSLVRISFAAEAFVSIVVCFCVIQYCLLVIFLDAKFVQMNGCLRSASKSFDVIFFVRKQTPRSRPTVSCIIFLKHMYTHLLEICNVVNDCFSAPILFITMYMFYNLTVNVFYIVVFFISVGSQDYLYLASLLTNVIQLAFPTCLLSFAVTKLRKETEETARIVHNLLHYTNDPELLSELSLFSLQLLHEKPEFTACGFFHLDCTLLQGIIGAVTTYMVILIQFQVSSNH